MVEAITVVIPTLGRPSLERALASVAHQSALPDGIILVANGSEALSSERTVSLADLGGVVPVQVLALPPLSGPAICRNVGAWQAMTTYVAFLDDDDAFAPDYLAQMGAAIENEKPDVLYGARIWRNSDGSTRRQNRLHDVPKGLWLERLYRNENPGFGGQNVVVRRDAFFGVGGFPCDLRSGEDRGFAMAVLRSGLTVSYVDAAEVDCHDPAGYRASRRSDKWLTNLKLLTDYWTEVSWRSRLRSLWRTFRSYVGR